MPFYFTPSRVASFFHSVCPSLNEVTSVFNTVLAHRWAYVHILALHCFMLDTKCLDRMRRLAH